MTAGHGRYFLIFRVGQQGERRSKIGVAVSTVPVDLCKNSGRALIDGSDTARSSGVCADGMPPTGKGRYKFEAIDQGVR